MSRRPGGRTRATGPGLPALRAGEQRRAYTMVEILFALAVASIVLYVVYQVLISGSRLFARGIAAARGPEAAILLMDRFEEDVVQALQAPGDPRPPVTVTDGQRLAFYRPVPALTTAAVTVGAPALWELEPSEDTPGRVHPVRDGVVLEDVEFGGWELALLAPDLDQRRMGWYLAVKARFPTDSRVGSDYEVSRLIYLPQPSSNFLHFPSHGDQLLPGVVQLLPPPEDDPRFEGLGPPPPRGAP